MNTIIESIHFDADNKLKNLILERTSGFSKIFERIESCKVILELKKNDEGQIKVVEISLIVPQATLFAKNHALTFELALDSVVHELKQQLKNYKEKKANADVTESRK
jgi:putative sigma-54 modulation protein